MIDFYKESVKLNCKGTKMSMQSQINKELKAFQKFMSEYAFEPKEIMTQNDVQMCDNMPIYGDDGKIIPVCEKWLNTGFTISNASSKVLSNLFPYSFVFKSQKLESIEAGIQSLKFPDPEMQKYVFKYSGITAFHVQATSAYNWKETGIVYWQGQAINRFSKEYDDFIDELYISAAQNPLYRSALLKVDKPIIHSIGKTDKTDTLLTRFELEKRLNGLSAFYKDYTREHSRQLQANLSWRPISTPSPINQLKDKSR